MNSENREQLGEEQEVASQSILRRKRRSKFDNEGRDFKCDECDKSYLSAQALGKHKRVKHSSVLSKSSPKLEFFNGKNKNSLTMFFSGTRKRKENENSIFLQNFAEQLYLDLYIKHGLSRLNQGNILESPLLRTLSVPYETKDDENPSEIQINDEILQSYLEFAWDKASPAYFFFLLKIVVLVREFVVFKNKSGGKASVSKFHAVVDEFIASFLPKHSFFGLLSYKRELVNVLQHFLLWLFYGKYTEFKVQEIIS